jgi:hypothetical protein
MLTFYPTSNTLNIVSRICFLLLCTFYFLSEGNTQTDVINRSEVQVLDIKKTGSDKVLLSWTGQSETNLNYYMVERSRDGVNYEEKAIFFGNLSPDSNQHYSFTDRGLAKGSYFYRIKMVNNDKSYRLCATNTVYFNDEKEQLQLVTFPNPSSSEIKVTLPDSWLQKKVTFEIYNTSGQLANKQTTNSASKTEALNITTLLAGIYNVKASTVTDDVAVGRIIKR